MSNVLLIATVAGTSLIALWLYVRFPGSRPKAIRAAVAHVVLSFLAMKLGQTGVRSTVAAFPEPYAVVLALVAITVPVLSYVFVSWVWLMASLRDLGGTPRGGHRVRAMGSA
jgi:hypothetical protein